VKVDLAEKLKAPIEYEVNLIDILLVVADFGIDNVSVLNDSPIVQLCLIYIRVL